MVSPTSVGRPRAIISSIGETHASQPQAQSDLMNYHSENFHKSTRGNGMTFLPMVLSKGPLWSGTFREGLRIWNDIVTLPIEKLMERFIGIPRVQSYDMRFKAKVWKPFIDDVHKGSNKTRFQYRKILKQRPLVCSRHSREVRRSVRCS